jgi:hypothetical protein
MMISRSNLTLLNFICNVLSVLNYLHKKYFKIKLQHDGHKGIGILLIFG